MFTLQLETGYMPRSAGICTVMFSTFTSGLEDVKEGTLSEFGDEAKLVAPVHTLGDIQRDPD